jgi:phosphatidate cytidylyltransferase
LSELIKRSLVALVGIPIAIAIIWIGDWLFTVTIAVISSVGLWEFYRLAEHKGVYSYKSMGIIINFILIILLDLLTTTWFGNDAIRPEIIIILTITILILLVSAITLWSKKENSLLNFSTTIFGIVYIAFSFASLIFIRNFSNLSLIDGFGKTALQNSIAGKEVYLVMAILFSIWICDSAAYFVGRKFGKHKLFPSVSPKKSWEGTIAGFIFGSLFFVCSTLLLPIKFNPLLEIPLIHIFMLGMIISSLGQIGDLTESKLKRDAGVKDSSNLIPGHGGILDRFDSIMFVFPSVLLYMIIFLQL